jgi:hypothetical protein
LGALLLSIFASKSAAPEAGIVGHPWYIISTGMKLRNKKEFTVQYTGIYRSISSADYLSKNTGDERVAEQIGVAVKF